MPSIFYTETTIDVGSIIKLLNRASFKLQNIVVFFFPSSANSGLYTSNAFFLLRKVNVGGLPILF